MNKIVIAVIALLIVGGVGLSAYLMLSKDDTAVDTMLEVKDQGGKKSLRELMGMTTNQTCTFKDEMQNIGTVYTGGGKFRADFSSTSNGVTMNTHMISDASTVYFWFDGNEKGFKMNLSEIEKTGDTGTSSSVDVDKTIDYTCKPWSVDQSKFALPDVSFDDFSAMMEAMPAAPSGTGDLTSMQCAACNNLPADAAKECKAALNCK